MIHYSAPLKVKLKHPKQFIAQLEQALSARDTIPLKSFKASFVRLGFTVSYQRGGVQSFYIAQGSSLLWGHRLYILDRGLKELIRQYIPDKDVYLPLLSKY